MTSQPEKMLPPNAHPPAGADPAGQKAEAIGEDTRRVVSQVDRRQADGFYHRVETLRAIVRRLIQSGDLELSES